MLSSPCMSSVLVSKQPNLDSSSLSCHVNNAGVLTTPKPDFEGFHRTLRTTLLELYIFNGKYTLEMSAISGVQ